MFIPNGVRIGRLDFVLSVGVLCLSLVSAASQTYVSPFGSDMNDGSEMHPVLTIERAVELTSASGTVYLEVGSFRLNPTGIKLTKSLIIRAKLSTSLPSLHGIICSQDTWPSEKYAFNVQKGISLTLIGVSVLLCTRNVYLDNRAQLTATNVVFKTTSVAVWLQCVGDLKQTGSRLTVDNSTFHTYADSDNSTAIVFENCSFLRPHGGRVATISSSTFESIQVLKSRYAIQPLPEAQPETITFVNCVVNGPPVDWAQPTRPLFDLQTWLLQLTLDSTIVKSAGYVANVDAVKEFTFLRSSVLGVDDPDAFTLRTAIRFSGHEDLQRNTRWQINFNDSIVRYFDRVVVADGWTNVNVWNSTIADNGAATDEDEEHHMVFDLTGDAILTIDNSIVVNNTGKEAGVVYAKDGSQFRIRNSTFKNNTASHTGGVFRCVLGAAGSVFSSTFAGNSAGDGGASIGSCDETCHAAIYDNDLSQNSKPEFEHCR